MKKEKPPKKPPKSRKSAEKESFYARLFDEADRMDFSLASGVDGIDDEIALLRVEIMRVVKGGDAANLRTIIQATNALERLIRTRYEISREQRKGLREAIGNVLRDIAVPLGITLGTEIISKKVG